MKNKIKLFLCLLLMESAHAPSTDISISPCLAFIQNVFGPKRVESDPNSEARYHTDQLECKCPDFLQTLGNSSIVEIDDRWYKDCPRDPLRAECMVKQTESYPYKQTFYSMYNMAITSFQNGFLLLVKRGGVINIIKISNCEELEGSAVARSRNIMRELAKLLIPEERKINDLSADPIRRGRLHEMQNEMRVILNKGLAFEYLDKVFYPDVANRYDIFRMIFKRTENVLRGVDQLAKGMLIHNPMLEIHQQDPQNYYVRLSKNALLQIYDPERRFISTTKQWSIFSSPQFLGSKLPWDGSQEPKVVVWYKTHHHAFRYQFGSLQDYFNSRIAESCASVKSETNDKILPDIFSPEAFPSFCSDKTPRSFFTRSIRFLLRKSE